MAANQSVADNVEFGAAMRAERQERGYSIQAFAERVELESREVEALERGEGNVTYLMVLRIARELGMGPVELVTRAGL
jgi:transcriptional regulator with XRE-family HTH domain